ncbi:PEP-CTERM/exosortase system-associated acyltransferase [Nitrosomonas sp. Nm33]|uniref:PEP-CTERM/exosortase system-associated acyltransferase n=1 Tax=Nitrosomonas sp. Nm33 TaxID=133724 RepID=UPI00089CA65C|nr:PEP-CTERM/exosortase system-associated acyltransferase [Nitrosomonas sp. Nm33]SDY14638.1 N-acyl amino acid synthase, PEP-CTERM/exosortase system-associated [Nitrosomonas sp. Nm33]
MNDIAAAFHEYFQIVIADDPVLLKQVFNLRYRILCIDNKYPDIDASSYPDELEIDEYDNRSLHLLLKHKPSNTFVGTLRLIFSIDADQKFPLELHTQFYPIDANMNVPRKQTVEISRFAILSNFFRRKDDSYSLTDQIAMENFEKERRRFPHPMLGLAVGVIQMCARYNIYHWFSAMNPALNRLLGFYGMQLEPIGPFVSYHGLRRPYYVCLLDVLERMYANHRDVWELVTDNGRIWPANLEHFKSICGHQQSVQILI